MNIRPTNLEPSALASPSAHDENTRNNDVNGTTYIPQDDTPSSPSETTPLESRSVIPTKEITPHEFLELIKNNTFRNDVHYQVEGDVTIENMESLTALPENLTITGNLYIEKCHKLKNLPENLTVTGCLNVEKCDNLKCLSENLSVTSLRLRECSELTDLPKNFSGQSPNDLIISDCSKLKALPENLTELRNMLIGNCASLKTLPKKLSVTGLLNLTECKSLTELPEEITAGAINLTGCTSLTTLSGNLSVEGNINFTGCISLTTLSENLSVNGYIDFDGCINLTTLPENLSAKENINFSGCTSLTTLPKNLSAGGYINLAGCYSLENLPEKFSVGGDLDFTGCTSLKTMRGNLSVGGNINFSGCTSLTTLPEELSAKGYIIFTKCTSLTTPPKTLSAKKIIHLTDCISLTILPENLYVRGDLDLAGWTSLTTLPKNFSGVKGNLNLAGCTSLKNLPIELSVGGDLILVGCTSLENLPEKLSVKGDLKLAGCTSLTTLGENLSVNGDIDFDGWTSLTTLPKKLATGGDIDLAGWAGRLENLPEDFFVGGDLDLTGCVGLIIPSAHLSVGGYLKLAGCAALQKLPEDLFVGRDLVLRHCSELKELPENLTVEGELDLEGCTSLRALPYNFSARRIHFGKTPEDQLSFLIRLWKISAEHKESIPELNLDQGEDVDLVTFLVGLQKTKDHTNVSTRPLLAKRVINALLFISGDEKDHEKAMHLIHDGVTTCEDKIALTLDELDTLKAVNEALEAAIVNSNPEKLKTLGVQMLRLEEIGKIARVHMRWLEVKESAGWLKTHFKDKEIDKEIKDRLESTLEEAKLGIRRTEKLELMKTKLTESEGFIKRCEKEYKQKYPGSVLYKDIIRLSEPVEVQLAFETGVGRRLDLPSHTGQMKFSDVSQVSEEAIGQAVQQIEGHCSDQKNIDDFLKNWDPWQKYQRKLKIPDYEALELRTVNEDIGDCPISGCTPDKKIAVVRTSEAGDERLEFYDYDSLSQWYILSGGDIYRVPFDWEQVVKVTVAGASSAEVTDNENRPPSS